MIRHVLQVHDNHAWHMVLTRISGTSDILITHDPEKALPGDSDTVSYFRKMFPTRHFRGQPVLVEHLEKVQHCGCGHVWSGGSFCPRCKAKAQYFHTARNREAVA